MPPFSLRLHVARTTQFDNSLPRTEINGYRFHTEIFGRPESAPLIVIHGGPGQGFQYLKSLQSLSRNYRVIFYDQRGAGLSPRVPGQQLTLQQNLQDLHAIVQHFSSGKKVKLVGHSWGGLLLIGYLSKHPEMVSQAVAVEPLFLYPGAPVRDWVKKFKQWTPVFKIISYVLYYPFVKKQDGHEGYDYIATKIANHMSVGRPYNCRGQRLPSNTFVRVGFAAHNRILQPIINNPDSFETDLTNGIHNYHGDLMLISSECSFFGSTYQEKYHLAKLPLQTIPIKAQNMGHNLLTLNSDWSLRRIENFLKVQ